MMITGTKVKAGDPRILLGRDREGKPAPIPFNIRLITEDQYNKLSYLLGEAKELLENYQKSAPITDKERCKMWLGDVEGV